MKFACLQLRPHLLRANDSNLGGIEEDLRKLEERRGFEQLIATIKRLFN